MKINKKVSLLLKTVLSIGLIALLIARVDFTKVKNYITGINLLPYLVAFLLIVAGTAGSTLKWKLLLKNAGIQRPFTTLLRFYYIGSFYNMFLPTTVGGDVIRTAMLGKESKEMVRTASSVFAERLFGLHALLGVASVSFFLSYNLFTGKAVEPILFCVFAGFCLLTLLFFFPALITLATIPIRFVFRKIGFHKGETITIEVEAAVQDLWSDKKNLFRSSLISLLFQLTLPLQAILVSTALRMDIPWQYFFAITPVSVLLTMIPISLNGIGVREWVAVFLYGSLGVDKDTIVTLSFMGFLLVTVNALIGGVVFLLNKKR